MDDYASRPPPEVLLMNDSNKDSHVESIIKSFEGIDLGNDDFRRRYVTSSPPSDPPSALDSFQVLFDLSDSAIVKTGSGDPMGDEDFPPPS